MAKFSTSLPLELRDQVYDYLWDQMSLEGATKACSTHHERTIPGLPCHGIDTCMTCAKHSVLPFFTRPSFVGKTAFEAVDVFFRKAVPWKLSYKDIDAFLAQDVFSEGIKLRDHIRCLSIKLDDRSSVDMEPNLEALSAIKNTDGFRLELVISEQYESPNYTLQLLPLLDHVKPTFLRLSKQCGFQVVFRFQHGLFRPENHSAFYTAEDLRDYCLEELECWLAKIEARDKKVISFQCALCITIQILI